MDGPFKVGQPFAIPLEFLDEFGNITKPSKDVQPELQAEYVLRSL